AARTARDRLRRVEGATHTVICPTVADALTQLKERLALVTDLERVGRVLSWDQQTMMPPAGWKHRADHLATLRRIQHETLIADETGRLLDELRGREGSLDPESDDAALIRVARRDYEKAVRVPTDLRAEMVHAGAKARSIWVKARSDSDFEQFRPALERNYELRQRYVECFDDVDELSPRDDEVVLLDDARIRARPLLAPAAASPGAPADRQRVLARHPRVAEPPLGEPRRPQPSVLAALLPACTGDVPRTAPER